MGSHSRPFEHEEGQSIVLVVLAMGIFLIGAVGLGFDGSHLYSERVRAQLAADAAAQAAMMSVFDGTYSTGTAKFTVSSGASYNCGGASLSNASTPCVYASKNGFNSAAGDTITLSYPSNPATTAPGVTFASGYPTELIQVEVDRSVPTTLMRLLGPSATTVKAVGLAAIVSVFSPVPIIVIHPTLTQSFSVQGNPVVQICGGPQRSIQVNSTDASAFNIGGNSAVDLSSGGPADTKGDCTTPGNGTDMGNWGGPTSITTVPGTGGSCAKGDVCIGSKGHYLQPASWIPDPLANVVAPTQPATVVTAPLTVAAGTYGCPAGTVGGCQLYTPGSYSASIDGKGSYNLFAPGIYYIQQTSSTSAFGCTAICTIAMATGLTDNSTTLTSTVTAGYATVTSCCGTNTSWDGTALNGGMLVYNSGAGAFNVGSNGSASLIGTTIASSYKGILFFENRTAGADASKVKNPTLNKFTPHSLGGGGNLSLIGTVYLTNTRATMLASPSQYQELDLSGNSGNSTFIQGEIIVDSLQMGGGGTIQMNLNANKSFVINQVALVQ